MQGVGRGRGAVLPAWMSKAQGASAAAAAPGSELGKRSWEPEEFGDGARPAATKTARTEPINTTTTTTTTPLDNPSVVPVDNNKAFEATLPEGWSSALDPTYNQYYYFNAATGERSWTKPSTEQPAVAQPETVTITELEPLAVIEPKVAEPEIAAEWQQQGEAEQEEQAAPTAPVSDLLPDGWASAFDPQHQRSYFYNLTTGQRTWIKPEAPVAVASPPIEQQEQQSAAEQPAEVVSSLPPGWGQATDEATGCIYYYNEAGDVQWYPPVVLPQQRIAGQGNANPNPPPHQQQPLVPGAAVSQHVQQMTNQPRAPISQQTPSSYNSSSHNRGGGRGAAYHTGGRDQGAGRGGRGGIGERGRGRGRGRGRSSDQQNRVADFDPMDPSAYSDTPRGGWGAGLESAARGGG